MVRSPTSGRTFFDTMANHREATGRLFLLLAESAPQFHPHPLTMDFALTHAWDKDIYVAMVSADDMGEEVLAYGMLRGWDEGFDIPSLGIAVDPSMRGMGLGRLMMQYLHTAAIGRWARQVRLKVYKDNVSAIRLYESLGYAWQPNSEEDEQKVGILKLR